MFLTLEKTRTSRGRLGSYFHVLKYLLAALRGTAPSPLPPPSPLSGGTRTWAVTSCFAGTWLKTFDHARTPSPLHLFCRPRAKPEDGAQHSFFSELKPRRGGDGPKVIFPSSISASSSSPVREKEQEGQIVSGEAFGAKIVFDTGEKRLFFFFRLSVKNV